MLNAGVDPSCLWDGLFLTAGELLMRQPGIVGLHSVTTINALHFAFTATGNEETRQLMLLQAAPSCNVPACHGARGPALRNLQVDTLERLDPTLQDAGD